MHCIYILLVWPLDNRHTLSALQALTFALVLAWVLQCALEDRLQLLACSSP